MTTSNFYQQETNLTWIKYEMILFKDEEAEADQSRVM